MHVTGRMTLAQATKLRASLCGHSIAPAIALGRMTFWRSKCRINFAPGSNGARFVLERALAQGPVAQLDRASAF